MLSSRLESVVLVFHSFPADSNFDCTIFHVQFINLVFCVHYIYVWTRTLDFIVARADSLTFEFHFFIVARADLLTLEFPTCVYLMRV